MDIFGIQKGRVAILSGCSFHDEAVSLIVRVDSFVKCTAHTLAVVERKLRL